MGRYLAVGSRAGRGGPRMLRGAVDAEDVFQSGDVQQPADTRVRSYQPQLASGSLNTFGGTDEQAKG